MVWTRLWTSTGYEGGLGVYLHYRFETGVSGKCKRRVICCDEATAWVLIGGNRSREESREGNVKRVFIVCKATVWRSCICSCRAGLNVERGKGKLTQW